MDVDRIIDELPLNGRTLDDGFAFFERRFASGPLKHPPQGMPDHPVAHGAKFDADRGQLAQLERCYVGAAQAFDEVRRTESDAGPVRCWPHHFDLATLITISGRGEEAHTIGAGMTPGDEANHEPYYYVTPWPYPKDPPMVPLTRGSWHTSGWFGAVLPALDADAPESFVVEAIRHCRMLV